MTHDLHSAMAKTLDKVLEYSGHPAERPNSGRKYYPSFMAHDHFSNTKGWTGPNWWMAFA